MGKDWNFRLEDAQPQMVVHGQYEAIVEQCGEIVLYDGERVQLRFGESWLLIAGKELKLLSMGPGGVTVRGILQDIRLFEGGFPCSD